MSETIYFELNTCIDFLNSKTHQENMILKSHSLHCIIHKHLGFFIYLYNQYGIQSSNGKFSCDFDWQHMNAIEYDINLKRPCSYKNINFIQYEQRAKQNLHHFNCKLNV